MLYGHYGWLPPFSGPRLRRSLENGLARIPATDLNVVFYLYPDRSAAETGQRVGGSGFWVGIQSEKIEYLRWIYAVSNRHVVHRGGASVIRANSNNGNAVYILEKEPTDWFEHPSGHDIVVLPIISSSSEVAGLSHLFVGPSMFATPAHLSDEVIGIGDEVYMIGRFINHEGTTRNTPSVRFGNISMLPGEPIYIDATSPPQESFAVELRSMCGYSGSPVFVQTGGLRKGAGWSLVAAPDYLLGVHWGHIIEPWTVETKIRKKAFRTALAPDEQEVDEVFANTGMNGVVPAWRLLELLNLPQFKKIRDEEEADEMKRIARTSPGAALDVASEKEPAPPELRDVSDDANPNHLADFTRLVDVAARKRPQGDQT